ncbi:MAG: T9SS type A sorting domain-containing protein [Bacteroidales bacterium]
MKTMLASIILLLSFSLISSAQSYQAILNEENSWNVFWGACDASTVDTVFSINDSTAGSKIFASLYEGNVSNSIGYLEEDTVEGKVMYHDTSGNSYLVFDMTLVPGDTLIYSNIYGQQVELHVSDTATVAGLKHIEFVESIEMCSFGTKISMIESVGPNCGIHTLRSFGFPFGYYLLCHYNSDAFYFGNELFNNQCFMNWNGIDATRKNDDILVQQAENELIITSRLHSGKLSVYNMHGAIMFKKSIYPGSNRISLKILGSGMYVYRIDVNNELVSGKLIKH